MTKFRQTLVSRVWRNSSRQRSFKCWLKILTDDNLFAEKFEKLEKFGESKVVFERTLGGKIGEFLKVKSNWSVKLEKFDPSKFEEVMEIKQ